jgi:C-terminal processing protease CtpA/Prc
MIWLNQEKCLPLKFHRAGKWVCIILLSQISLQNLFCSKKIAAFEPTDELGINNKWVYDSLKLYYYWNDKLPGKPDYSLATTAFFKSLLPTEDRFSVLFNGRDVMPAKSTFEQYGFHYSLVTHPFDAQGLVGIVTMVMPGTDAANRHLQRGAIFTKVNNVSVSTANISAINNALAIGSLITLQLAVLSNNGTSLSDSTPVTFTGGNVPYKSIYSTHYFEKNGVKTGYLAYFLCYESEDDKLLESMQKFKNAGIRELILDLRFNPGGSVASSAKLAAMLVPAFNPDQVYVTFQGNRHGGTVKQTFRQTIAFSGNGYGKRMQELQDRNAGLQRVFILTSAATVSAAEILCNNLKPYLQVIRIGGKTHGKDEASFRIEDKRNPRQVQWILMPTVYKVADANGRGGYDKGLPPDHTINEFSRLPLQPMGYPGDQPVDKALELIYGSTAVDITPLRNKVFSFHDIKEQYQSAGAANRSIEIRRPN